jgi:hypothetical protein
MREKRPCFFLLSLFLMLIFLQGISWPQMTLGQYEDEAPFRTWNILGITTASSLALGETQFTTASDCSAALSNPSLLSSLPKITVTLSSSLSSASFFKYSIVNTGVLYSDKNISLNLLAFDFAGAAVRVKKWSFALSTALLESYDRPQARASSSSYSLSLDQKGNLKNINFSAALKISGFLSAGIGLNFISGHFNKDISDEWTEARITITDSLSHEFRGFYFNGGLLLDLRDRIKVAAAFRMPYVKKSRSCSLKRYEAPAGNTDIRIEASASSEYRQPLIAGLGVSYKFSPLLQISSDLTYFKWSKYRIIYFEQADEVQRNFKDIVKIGAGVEYLTPITFLGQRMNLPLRAGLSYDPQPMEAPSSSYLYYSLGTGLHWGNFFLDWGMLFGKESGSGDSLSGRRYALSLSFKL